MKKFMFLLIPLALACGDAEKAAEGAACGEDADCASGHCHIDEGASEGVCEGEDDHDGDDHSDDDSGE